MADKERCRVIVKRESGEECELPVDECTEGQDGCRVIIVHCDADTNDCCCPKK
jgi:hypothetical protein